MKHLHIIDEIRVGGAQTHLITMLHQIRKVAPDVEHRVLSLFGDGNLHEAFEQAGATVEVLKLTETLRNRQVFRAAAEIQKVIERERPDLVEAHLTWSRGLGLYAAWRAGVPLRIGFEQGDVYLNSLKFRVLNFVAQWYTQTIVVCSRALKEWNRATHKILSSKLLVLHNCVDVDRFHPRVSPAADIGFEGNPCIFAAVGTLGRGVNKRMDVIIRAVAEARKRANVALVICGDGDQRTDLEQLASELGVAAYVKLLGTRSDVPNVLRACDAFCHASSWEPFGIVAIEAMALGLPIIVPNSGGIREIPNEGVDGFLYPVLDHAALAEKMVVLASSEELARRMGAAGRNAVVEKFSVEKYVRDLYSAYGIPLPRAVEVAQ
jgi:glycosyltransferase involved in cell wall biosynthesis